MKKKISILGSTGSIGLSSLKIIKIKRELFQPYIFSANKNYKKITNQIKLFKPEYFIIHDKNIYEKIKKKFSNKKTKILNDFDKIKTRKKSDITISAIPGISGLKPTLILTKLSKKILIANKESIICAWKFIKSEAKRNNTKIVPIDSEHFSILKLLEKQKSNDIKKIYITASGGPFLNLKLSEFKNIKLKDALKHPKWKMGKKITVDSATLMNKLFELVEAQKLFNLPDNKIDILIHPESLVHAIVELKNGLTKFIYHETSMLIPIVNAIFEENLSINEFLNARKSTNRNSPIKNISFRKVNEKIFPTIKLKKSINKYPSSSIIFNASNEILVDQFLQKNIPFTGIFKIILTILKDKNYRKYAIRNPKNINQIILIDKWSRQLTMKKVESFNV